MPAAQACVNKTPCLRTPRCYAFVVSWQCAGVTVIGEINQATAQLMVRVDFLSKLGCVAAAADPGAALRTSYGRLAHFPSLL